MFEYIDGLVDFVSQNASNPTVRIAFSVAGAFSSALGYQKVVEKAKIISAKAEQRGIDKADNDCEKDIEYRTEVLFYNLKTELYDGITEYIGEIAKTGKDTIPIEVRDETINNRKLPVIRLMYNKSIKDIRKRAKARLIYDVKDIIKKGNNSTHKREESVNKVARDYRTYFFGELHKLSGRNSGILDMEAKVANFEYFVDLINNLLTQVEEAYNICDTEKERVRSESKIKTFNIKKIYDTIFHGRERL